MWLGQRSTRLRSSTAQKHEIMEPEAFEQPESWVELAFSSGETPCRGVDHGKV
jgi:hypothetical protein